MKTVPYIWTESYIGADGCGYVTVIVREPSVIPRTGLFNGGCAVHFDVDWKKQTTEAWAYTFRAGAPFVTHEKIKKWKDEILANNEMLRFAWDWYLEQTAS